MNILRIRPSVRSMILVALWVAVTGLGANVVWLAAFAQQAVIPQVALSSRGEPVAASKPYTVVLQESTRDPSGEVRTEGTLTMALRSDGGYTERYEHVGGQQALIQRTVDLPSGVTVVIDDVRELRTTTVKRLGTSSRARMDSSRGCIKNNSGEILMAAEIVDDRERVKGYQTVQVKLGETTFWLARDLGCAKVKSRTRLSDGTINEKVAVVITPGEPDDALFHVPDRYNEVQHSIFFGLDPSSRAAIQLDRTYYSRRPPQ